MLRGLTDAPVRRVKSVAKRAIAGLVATVDTARHDRWYYANRWHPYHALLADAQAETVAYIKANMVDALIRRDEVGVIRHALDHAPSDGLVLEFGVRTGHTIGHIARRRRRGTVHGFDSFEGLPEAWSGYTMDAGAFGGEGLPQVPDNVELHVGWFDDTLPPFLETHEGDLAFAHVDSDVYSSARTVLGALAPRIRPGSVIVFNEYFNYPNWQQHEYRAFQEFCTGHDVSYDYLSWGMYEVAVIVRSIGEHGEATGTHRPARREVVTS